MKQLALLGGEPAFPHGLPFARPAPPPLERVVARLAPSYGEGRLTDGPLVRALEDAVATRLGVEHVIAVASCTAGLMLAVRALAPGERVALPSFTFVATAHAAAWNGCPLVFADCDPQTFQVDPDDLSISAEGAGLLVATHVFGAPAPVEELQRLASASGKPLLLDAAHALGATRRGRPLGQFGDAEVFSLSPTKLVVAGEGGLVVTNRADVAEAVRVGREYGNRESYDSRFVGLNARMSEMHAAVALESLVDLDEHLAVRRSLAARYRGGLAGIPGVRPQLVEPGDESTFKDLTIAIEPEQFGADRDHLVAALAAEGVDTRCYFSPPVHRQEAYDGASASELPVTESVAARVVSLPMYRDLAADEVDRVLEIIVATHRHADELRERVAATR